MNREMALVVVKHFDNTTNAYGEVKKGTAASEKSVEMLLKVYRQTDVQDPRYTNATHIGLTHDNSISPGDLVESGEDKYNVLYVIPSQRLQTIMLEKVV